MTTPRMTTDHLARRDQVAGAIFSLWVVLGLFLDGWAHNADKPEDFWTPWHAVLYSGFVASMVWFGIDGARRRARGIRMETPKTIKAGYGLFALGGVGDGIWHTVFGVEEDVEALLSPTHLMLMLGGLLLVTEAVRTQMRVSDGRPSLRVFWPAATSIMLALSVIAFFTQFASAFGSVDHETLAGAADHDLQVFGVVTILLTNALFLGAAAWTLRHWPRPPVGTFTLIFGGTALLMSGLEAFDQILLTVPALAAGLIADVLIARGTRARTVLGGAPLTLWLGWFAIYDAVWGLGWAPELWTGSVVFAMLTGAGLAFLALPTDADPAPRRDAHTEPADGAGDGRAQKGLRAPHRRLAELLS